MLDLTNDFTAVSDDLVAVTIRAWSGATPLAVSAALSRAITVREVETSHGKYTRGDVAWHLPVSQVPQMPAVGARIVDPAANLWTILEVSQQTLASRWRCVCRNLAIVFGLNSLVTIQKATYVKQPAGDVQPQWSDWLVGLRARIQPEASAGEVAHERRLTRGRFRIFLAEHPPEPLDQSHRVVAVDGGVYLIEGYESPKSLTELYTIVAQQVPFPNASRR